MNPLCSLQKVKSSLATEKSSNSSPPLLHWVTFLLSCLLTLFWNKLFMKPRTCSWVALFWAFKKYKKCVLCHKRREMTSHIWLGGKKYNYWNGLIGIITHVMHITYQWLRCLPDTKKGVHLIWKVLFLLWSLWECVCGLLLSNHSSKKTNRVCFPAHPWRWYSWYSTAR